MTRRQHQDGRRDECFPDRCPDKGAQDIVQLQYEWKTEAALTLEPQQRLFIGEVAPPLFVGQKLGQWLALRNAVIRSDNQRYKNQLMSQLSGKPSKRNCKYCDKFAVKNKLLSKRFQRVQ